MLYMLDIILVVVFVVVSFRLTAALLRESAVLAEFAQSRSLVFAVALFPVGPLLLLASPAMPLPLTIFAASGCYLPSMVIARRQDRALQRAGTDRVNMVRAVIERCFGSALAGLLYVVVVSVFTLGALSIKSVGGGA